MNRAASIGLLVYALSMAATATATAPATSGGPLSVESSSGSTKTTERSLSEIQYSYNDGLTICPCDDGGACLGYAPKGSDAISLCFRTDGDGTLVEALEQLTLDLGDEVDEEPIVVDRGVVRRGATVVYARDSCTVRAPVANDPPAVDGNGTGTIVARGTVVLRYSDADGDHRDGIDFEQTLELKEAVAVSTERVPRFDEHAGDDKEQLQTSGYSMITGVVILLPTLWGVAAYIYNRAFPAAALDDEDGDGGAGADAKPDGDLEEGSRKPQGIIVCFQREKNDDDDWETITFE